MKTRLSRLCENKQIELNKLMAKLNEESPDSDILMHQFGSLTQEIDSFDPIKLSNNEMMTGQYHIYKNVWPEVEKIRETGELLELGKRISCPVIAIHGNFDPHSYQGVQEPLKSVINNFTFILLDKCGHEPWIERQAKNKFLNLIETYLQD